MEAPASSSRRVRIGLFEVDFGSAEVHREGRKVPLQEQPFRVLVMLLERPGEIVSREELQARLWPSDTYVGFDEGLNTAIRKLRVAFGDSAENPRFVETLPRRGYRLIAPVAEGVEAAVQSSETAAVADTTADVLGDRPGKGYWPVLAWPAAALLLILAGVAYTALRHSSPNASSKSLAQKRVMLAVLPFQNLSNDPTQEYYSDGLTEETITDLGQLSPAQLGVIARTSAMAYKHSDKTITQIGHELGVDYILEGSVRRENGRARISAQLIRVSDQTHLWAQSYDDQGLRNFLDVQNEIGRAIADQVQVSIAPQRQIEMSKMHAVNPEAMDLYLKGRFYWNQRTPAAIRESIRLFSEATVADPGFALAYAGLADAYNI